MSVTKLQREKKRQMGQFLTPPELAKLIVNSITLSKNHRVLEPSMGDGSFILPLIERFLDFYSGPVQKRLDEILTKNIWGVEMDSGLYHQCLQNIKERWGYLPEKNNFVRQDFFKVLTNTQLLQFDTVIGNPPFGGSFDPTIEDELDAHYGFRGGEKIKKETYAFFTIKGIDLLKKEGELVFICSDTFLTINTMRGLRSFLINGGDVHVEHLNKFSAETSHPMVVLRYVHRSAPGSITVDNCRLLRESVEKTANLSFGLKPEFEKYFVGPRMGDFFTATSGMTTGKNEYFVREIQNGYIEEPYRFSFHTAPIRLKEEIQKARLGILSPKQQESIRHEEEVGGTYRAIRIEQRIKPIKLKLPDQRYRFYNKASNSIVYAPPTHVIYWENEGEAVLTYKKTGNWYLRGVGGQKFFLKEGITWQLIASRLHMSYLPKGYILDSGAPCAFPKKGISHDEVLFALGWALTSQCNVILKTVINHTKNIQGKDFERLPYPFWVTPENKKQIVALMKGCVGRAMAGERFSYKSSELAQLENLFVFPEDFLISEVPMKIKARNLALF